MLWALASAVAIALVTGGCAVQARRVRVQTCERCASTRQQDTTYLLGVIPRAGKWAIGYKSPRFAGCSHQWSDGIHMAVPNAVPDGVVVLVRQDQSYGAFILKDQNTVPETTNYSWYYRPFGKGPLDPSSPSVQHGEGRGSPIEFGPFSVSWSGASPGRGWLYYKCAPGAPISRADLHLCVTSETDIKKVDPADPKWVYKASVSDPGS